MRPGAELADAKCKSDSYDGRRDANEYPRENVSHAQKKSNWDGHDAKDHVVDDREQDRQLEPRSSRIRKGATRSD